MNTEKAEAMLKKLHTYLMNNHGTIYVCKKCGIDKGTPDDAEGGEDGK